MGGPHRPRRFCDKGECMRMDLETKVRVLTAENIELKKQVEELRDTLHAIRVRVS